MDNIGYQVVGGSVSVLILHVIGQKVSKLNVTQGKIDYCRIFLNKEIVFGKPLNVQNDVPEIK